MYKSALLISRVHGPRVARCMARRAGTNGGALSGGLPCAPRSVTAAFKRGASSTSTVGADAAATTGAASTPRRLTDAERAARRDLKRTSRLAALSADGEVPRSALWAAVAREHIGMYSQLGKARLSALVVSTTAAGYLLAGVPASWTTFGACCAGTALCAASANTFNQVIEAHTDKLMKRTFQRPLPSGRMSRVHAGAFGALSGAVGVATLAATCGPVTAALGAANIGLYAGVYTPLKRVHTVNTTVGSVVGAIPPVMGWVAATSVTASAGIAAMAAPEALLSGALLFCWQFPHFHALAWLLRRDYAAGGHSMHVVTDPSGRTAALHSLLGVAGLAAVPFASVATGITGSMFAVEGLAVNSYVALLAYRFYRSANDDTARPLFRASLWYLPLMMALMVYHSRNWRDAEGEPGRMRDALKGACPHELIVDGAAGGAAGKVASPAVVSATAAGCPVVVAEEKLVKGGNKVA